MSASVVYLPGALQNYKTMAINNIDGIHKQIKSDMENNRNLVDSFPILQMYFRIDIFYFVFKGKHAFSIKQKLEV